MKKSSSPPTLIRRGLLLCGIVCSLTLSASAQQPPPAPVAPGGSVSGSDPFLKTTPLPPPAPGAIANEKRNTAWEGLVRLEFFSLPPKTARRVLRMYPSQADLYQWVESQLETEGAEAAFEHVTVLRLRSGQKSKVEEVSEYPYATEFTPPQIPQTLTLGVPLTEHRPVPAVDSQSPPAGGAGAADIQSVRPKFPSEPSSGDFKANAMAQNFEVKNAGFTLEMELTYDNEGVFSDVNLAVERIRLADTIITNADGELTQPVFDNQRISTQILAKSGMPAFVGTFSPPFAAGTPGGIEEPRVWLLFLTVTLVTH